MKTLVGAAAPNTRLPSGERPAWVVNDNSGVTHRVHGEVITANGGGGGDSGINENDDLSSEVGLNLPPKKINHYVKNFE